MSHESDLERMQQIARGSETHFRAVYQEHKDRVLGICMRLMGQAAKAEDLAQETWLKVIQKAHLFRRDTSLKAWLAEVTRNTCLNALRRQGEILMDQSDLELAQDAEIEETTFANEDSDRLKAAFDQLPTQQRVVLTMAILEELSHSEIATQLSLSVGAVKQLIFRAKQNLKGLLK